MDRLRSGRAAAGAALRGGLLGVGDWVEAGCWGLEAGFGVKNEVNDCCFFPTGVEVGGIEGDLWRHWSMNLKGATAKLARARMLNRN